MLCGRGQTEVTELRDHAQQMLVVIERTGGFRTTVKPQSEKSGKLRHGRNPLKVTRK